MTWNVWVSWPCQAQCVRCGRVAGGTGRAQGRAFVDGAERECRGGVPGVGVEGGRGGSSAARRRI